VLDCFTAAMHIRCSVTLMINTPVETRKWGECLFS